MPNTQLQIKTPTGTQTVNLSDVRPYWLYDTVVVANGFTQDYFFRTPQSKVLADTNLRQFSTIQVGWTYEVSAMRIIPRWRPAANGAHTQISDIENVLAAGTITFLREGDIEIFNLPIAMMNSGCGITGYATTANQEIASLGTPADGAKLKNPVRFLLYGGETFNFRFDFNGNTAFTGFAGAAVANLTANLPFHMVLDGILKRGVSSS
jgi:hypothetical protein